MVIQYEGTVVKMGGKDYTLPPLTLKSLRLLGPTIKELGAIADIPTPEQVSGMVALVHASAVRNYPDLTPEDLEELMDLGNLSEVFGAIMAASGLKKVAPGEAKGPQE
jgi:hypothetical protein